MDKEENKIWRFIKDLVSLLLNKIPGVKIKVPELEEDIKRKAEKGAAGSKNISTQMKNKINVKVEGGLAGGTTAGAIGEAVAKATQSVFALELKKVLISAI